MKYSLEKYSNFLDNIFLNLDRVGIDCSNLPLDHIAYRVKSYEEYLEIKKEVEKNGELVSENIIRDRPVAVYKLRNPFNYKNRSINCLEIPAPGQGDDFESGLEHAEFVVKEDLSLFMQKFSNLEFINKIEEKKNNPEIILKFNDKLAVKFHNQPLLEVVNNEKNGVACI